MLFIRLIWHNKKLTNRKEQLINHICIQFIFGFYNSIMYTIFIRSTNFQQIIFSFLSILLFETIKSTILMPA